MLQAAFRRFPVVFAGLKGRNGAVREYGALVNPGCEYCILPKVDAFALGYPEATYDDPVTPADNTLTYTGLNGDGQAALIKLAEVRLGDASFEDVEFLAVDLPQITTFDVVLGWSLLKSTKLEIDYANHSILLGEASGRSAD